jgi:hypothetical protein
VTNGKVVRRRRDIGPAIQATGPEGIGSALRSVSPRAGFTRGS